MNPEAFNQLQDELNRQRAYITELEAQLKTALAGQVPEHHTADASTIWMEPIISHRTKEGLVNLRWGNLSAQLPVAKAREHALSLLQIAEAAETDAFLFQYFTWHMKVRPERMGQVLQAFRAYREEHR